MDHQTVEDYTLPPHIKSLRIQAVISGGPSGSASTRLIRWIEVNVGDPDIGFRGMLPGHVAHYRYRGTNHSVSHPELYSASMLPVFEWVGWRPRS